MSQYQPGQQAYYGQNSNNANGSTPHSSQYAPYSPPADQVQPLRRTPSYIAGDDSLYASGAPNETIQAGQVFSPVAGTYNAFANTVQANLGSRHSQFSVGSSQRSNPSRASSHGSSATSTYHTQSYSSSVQTPTQSNIAYNPQQYARPHSLSQPPSMSYNPQAYTSVNSTAGQTHQTYNPAAYQPNPGTGYTAPNILRQPSARYYSQQASYTMPSPQSQQPPPPPPRGTDHPYGPRSPQLSDSSPNPTYASYSYGSHLHQQSQTSPVYASNQSYTSASPQSLPSRQNSHASQAHGYFPQVPSSSSEPLLEEQPPAPPVHKRSSLSGTSFRASEPSLVYQSSPPSLSPRRTDTLTRHPQSRPLPGPPPSDTEVAGSYNGAENTYEDLMKEVEAAVQGSSQSMGRNGLGRIPSLGPQPSGEEYRPLFSNGTRQSPDSNHTHTNGSVATGTGQYVNYDAYSDESDAEAAAGIAMMQMAEEEERAEAARQRSRGATISSLFPPYASPTAIPNAETSQQEASSDSDYAHHDLALYGGGYEGQMHYGDTPNLDAETNLAATNLYPPDDNGHMPAFHFTTPARVDTGGTGGLSEPSASGRRLSFDYGDEDADPVLDGDIPSGSQSPEKGEPADLFYHPGMRPLPPAPVEPANNADVLAHLIPAGTYRNSQYGEQETHDQYRPLPQPTSSDSSGLSLPNPYQVPRSTSLSSHSSTPRTDAPIRSKTDADRVKYKQQQEFLRQQAADMGTLGFNASPEPSAIALDLPTIPAGRRKKFNPAKLSSEQFRKCTEPWALSAIVAWVKDLSEDETDLKEQAVVDAIVALFTHKVPTMNTADAETLGSSVAKNMLSEGALIVDEEWVKFSDKSLSGVLFQITGSGCYSPRLHAQETETYGRCYSHHCMRTLKKINLRAQAMEPQKKAQDWVTFYNVPKEVWESHPRKEIDRQNNLHEIVTTEDAFIEQLDVLRVLYRDQLATMQPSIISPKRQEKFLRDVFGKVDAVKKVNEDYLLAQLKYRQKEQGPFIAGFSDIFREWIRKAKGVYIDYAATFPNANYMVRKEAERNAVFRQFLNQARDNKLSNRLSWDTYLKAPITRIQRYTLLLSTVYKNMPKDSEEKTNLALAIEEIKVVALECDNKVGEMTKKVDLAELSAKLQLRPGMSKEVELNLEHLGREIMFQGDLQRPGTRTRFNLVDTHAILFDHYLVLAKTVQMRDTTKTGKFEVYDVSKLPIPMDLLVLESTNDDPVIKSSVRGVSTITPPTAAAAAARGAGPGTLATAGTANSAASFVASTSLENSKDDKILYPFKVKHLGKMPTYTLFAPSAQNRQDWCQKITEAKTRHASSLFAQNAEPFRLRVLADAAFTYSEAPGAKTVMIKGTPLDRAIREVEARYASIGIRPNPVCRAMVNCATVFQQPSGQLICAIGTDIGVFMSRYDDPRGWQKAISIRQVTQISVFEDFNLLLLIAEKSLIAYHLDVVCPPSGAPSQTSQHDSARRAPQKISGNREVGFFSVGRMKDRILVFYKKRDGISSTFKVIEPVLHKSTTTRSRFLGRRGQTEFFREYDEFYIPAESYNINLFHSSLAISTQRGIEVLTLDKKQPWSLPILSATAPEAQPYLTSIGNRIKDLRPLGMFRLSDAEFLLAYSECAVYVNKLGDVSRSVVMEFVGRAHTACLHGKFLILLNDDFVEVRNAMNGRLRQVIPGRNVVCLDDGGNISAVDTNNTAHESNFTGANGHSSTGGQARNGRTVKICMQHPEYERSQIVVELIANEEQND
ncbi:Rho guanyl nucleotide exchange factor, putative [Talaromyces stipitatus ATCC 10500]|uniref:Rho guanyl nucleotide exchange factor, putative n=1 Tax=Talaromyces stipitatus (strain ATCC 10500 / CBS 375.48 / QM 6759 / NRRL 1006) TaxID=441959 RepID=B8MR37_TALSN|nr:Rho guanyl nucleotide exchange factor, putative [Talaromyces stipitatus ATCC 10500]EED12932.1 Rho guanyl nucleotide exchange factor, putative [Talaromyces stipitatus ATCC 10500]